MNLWIEEVCNALFTVCGASQTSDTGQIWSPNTATGTLPGAANTSAGYVIGKFNDTLQSTAAVFFRIDFGSGAAVADPAMWITVGTGSNGSGTINGTTMVKAPITSSGGVTSTSTNWSSYYVYNATYGVLGMAFKMGSVNTGEPVIPLGGFYLFRGSTSAGASNSDSINLIAATASGNPIAYSNPLGCMQCISYAKSAVYPTTAAYGFACLSPMPFGYQGALAGYNGTVALFYYMNPQICISAVIGMVNNADVNVGSTFSTAIIGSTSLTFINVGAMFGGTTMGASSTSVGGSTTTSIEVGALGGSATTGLGVAMLWQ
jgi:hypothetical protein